MAYSAATAHLHSIPSQRELRRTDPAPATTFTSLSPGEQRIARALYEAQKATSDARAGESKVRSLDEVAGMERNVCGWNQVFKQLKAEGLLVEQTLGHVVARWTRLRRPVRTAFAEALQVASSPVPSRTA